MDLSAIIDALKDFATFAGNIVKLFRGVPDLLLNLGGLGEKATTFPTTEAPAPKK